MVYEWIERLQGWLYPPTCILCGAEGDGNRDLCTGCAADLPENSQCCSLCALPLPRATADTICGHCLRRRPLFDRCLAAYRYEPPADELIHGLKFHRRLNHARLLGALLGDYLEARLDPGSPPECLIPVPLHPRGLRERGFNQAVELARPLAKRLGIPLEYAACRRTRSTEVQTGLTALERRRNLRGAFEVKSITRQAHVALVDDVVTTGSTANELARVLRRSGVKRVEVWAVCRTPPPGWRG
ncbi:MAG: ComF family protein [Gammaproteobacteria bacterium]